MKNKYDSPYPDIHTSTALRGPAPTYSPSYLSGIDLSLQRTNKPELSDNEKRYLKMKLNHGKLEGSTISIEESNKLQKISDLAKFRPSRSRDTGIKIIESNPKNYYTKQYKYSKEELDKYEKK